MGFGRANDVDVRTINIAWITWRIEIGTKKRCEVATTALAIVHAYVLL